MAYMIQVRGRLLEYSDTLKMFRPHLFRSSSSLDSSSSFSVLTPKREMLLLESEGPWETFLTPLICVISCCFCCFFFSLVLDVGDGISTSFCLSVRGQKKKKLKKWTHSIVSFFVCLFPLYAFGLHRLNKEKPCRNTCCMLFSEGYNSLLHTKRIFYFIFFTFMFFLEHLQFPSAQDLFSSFFSGIVPTQVLKVLKWRQLHKVKYCQLLHYLQFSL